MQQIGFILSLPLLLPLRKGSKTITVVYYIIGLIITGRIWIGLWFTRLRRARRGRFGIGGKLVCGQAWFGAL